MKIKQIRNATIKLSYAGKIFLIDPWLTDRHKFGCFADLPGKPFSTPDPVREQIPMPICELPMSVEEILRGVDFYIVTHLHPDHIDMAPDGTVGAPLDKNVPLLAQNDDDSAVFKRSGFANVHLIGEQISDEIKLTKTPARHGTIAPLGEACGIIFTAPNEKTLYLVGDTVWFAGVEDTLKKFRPDVVIVNACAAELLGNGRLIMNDEDIDCIAQTLPSAQIIVSHMDNVAHATITRHEMRGLLAKRKINCLMPDDGETLKLN